MIQAIHQLLKDLAKHKKLAIWELLVISELGKGSNYKLTGNTLELRRSATRLLKELSLSVDGGLGLL